MVKFDVSWRAGVGLGPGLLAAMLLAACGGGQDGAAETAAAAGTRVRAAAVAPPVSGVLINELHVANWKGATDEDGSVEDWVELYNSTDRAVDLSRWGLGVKATSPFRWVFPDGATIAPGGYLTVWLSKKDRAVVGRPLHASFNLDNGADGLLLSALDASGATVRVDSATPPLMQADTSWCRLPSGAAAAPLLHCQTPTPGGANGGTGFAALPAAPTASVGSGLYSAPQTVSLTVPAGTTVRYTFDGSEPTPASPAYGAPLTLGSATVLRAAAFAADGARSLVETRTYVVDATAAAQFAGQRVVFIAMPPADRAALEAKDKTLNSHSAVEMLAADRTRLFKADAETDVAGQEGSLQWPQMGIDVTFRDAFGAKNIKAALWPDKPGLGTTVKKFRLRNGGNDWSQAHLRDQFAQSLARLGPNLYASSSTVNVFLNGQYYAMADLREHETETLVEANLGVDRDTVDWINDPLLAAQEIKNGGAAALASFTDAEVFITGNDMSVPALYDRAKTLVNVESLAHDWALHLFVVNLDWPQRNVRVWRTPALDGRWQWSPHDLDWAFNLLGHGPETDNNFQYDTVGSDLLRYLLVNPEFRQLFVNANADLMNSTLTPAAMRARLDTMVAEMRPYVAPFQARWNLGGEAAWDAHLARLRDFIDRREAFHDQNLRNRFGLSARRSLTIGVNDPAMGTVRVNTLNLSTLLTAAATPWQGKYYPEVPVTLQALPRPGFVFVGWQGASSASTPTLQHSLAADAGFTAQFAPLATVAAPVIAALPPQLHATGERVELQPVASDPQGYALTWSAKALPNGLNLDPVSGRIFGKTTTPGSFSTVLTVTNGKTPATLALTWIVRDQPGSGLAAAYWSNPDFSGPPVLTRDTGLGLSLGGGESPGAGLPSSRFAVRWSGTLTAPVAGLYTFQTETSAGDGVRLWVNDQLLVDNWSAPAPLREATITLAAGAVVPLRVEFWDAGAEASLAVRWKMPGATGFVPVSMAVLARAVNLPPVLGAVPDQRSALSAAVSLPVSASDPEGGALFFSATGLPAGLALDAASGRITGLPGVAGDYPVTISVADEAGQRSTTGFTWTVTAAAGGLLNGGFESPVLVAGSFRYAPAGVDGWLFTGSAALSAASSGFTTGTPASGDGSQVVALQGQGSIRQSASITPGDVLAFDAIQRLNYSTGDQSLAVFVDGVQQGPVLTPGRAGWASQRVTLVPAAAGTHVLELRGLSSGTGEDRTALVDAFRLEPASSGSTLVAVAGGGFEAPALAAGAWQYAPGGTPWAYGGSAGVSGAGSAFTTGAPAPVAGQQLGFLQKRGRMSQALTLNPGDVLVFQATQRVNFRAGLQELGVFVNGVQQGGNLVPADGAWSAQRVPLSVGTAGTYTLEIRGLFGPGADDRTAFIDELQIERQR